MNAVIEQIVAIEAVNETSSRFVMGEIKTNPQVTAVLSDEMKASLLDGDEDPSRPISPVRASTRLQHPIVVREVAL